jgi:hypothetical protein
VTPKCACVPLLTPDVWLSHEIFCPRNWDVVTTAEQLASRRLALAAWHEQATAAAQGSERRAAVREAVAELAAGLTARAVELGLETP